MSKHFIDQIVSINDKVLDFSAGTYEGSALVTQSVLDASYETAAATAARTWLEADISDLQPYLLAADIAGKADISYVDAKTWVEADITDLQPYLLSADLAPYYTSAQVDAKTWVEADITDLQDYALNSAVNLKQDIMSGGSGISLSGAAINIDLAVGSDGGDVFVLSGQDAEANDTYTIVKSGGVPRKLKVSLDQEDVLISTEREAEFQITISGATPSSVNGVYELAGTSRGYFTRVGEMYVSHTGAASPGSTWFYRNIANSLMIAYNNTDSQWEAHDLSQASGSVAALLAALNDDDGYVGSGKVFIGADADRMQLGNSSVSYTNTTYKIPAASLSNVAFTAASAETHYMYQNAANTKTVFMHTDESSSSKYWTAIWHDAFDLDSAALSSDDAVQFTLDHHSDWDYITLSSDDYGDGVLIPDAAHSSIAYAASSSASYLEFSSGQLAVSVKDEDDMSSNSAAHVPTQQSVKAYVDVVDARLVSAEADVITAQAAADAAQADLDVAEATIALEEAKVVALQSALAAAEQDIDDAEALLGAAANAVDLGAFSGATISDDLSVKDALQELETAVEGAGSQSSLDAVINDVGNLQTMSGMADEADDLGAFSGSVIADNSNIKSALQALETELESVNLDNSGQGRWFFADLEVGVTDDAAILGLSSGAHIMEIRVNTTVAFNGASPSVTVGWTADSDAVVAADEFSLGSIEKSAKSLHHKMASQQDVRVYIDGGSSTGACEVALLVIE